METSQTVKIHAIVLACLLPGFLDVIIGHGSGLLDGGYIDRIPVRYFPPDCRMPNTTIFITYLASEGKQIVRIKRMN